MPGAAPATSPGAVAPGSTPPRPRSLGGGGASSLAHTDAVTLPTPSPPGARLRAALDQEQPLQVVGTVNAYSALLAQRAGFRAAYLSGAGVANASRGLPDLGFTTLDDVVTDTRRVAAATSLPLLVDADTGWDDPAEAVRRLAGAGAAGVHLEDQVDAKRCGHRPGKRLVAAGEMVERLRAACAGRPDPSFVVMARTDAAAVEGLAAAVARALRYVAAGADMIFAEALTSEGDFAEVARAVPVPVLANMTEFGVSPLLTAERLGELGIRLVLYPLSAFRAMSRAAQEVYAAIRRDGTQLAVLGTMQTRAELYEVVDYEAAERRVDERLEEEGT